MTSRFTKATGGQKSSRSGTDASASGAMDEDSFEKLFEEVPQISVFSAKDVTDRMARVKETISDASIDWEKRVNALKEIRSLIVAGALNLVDFTQQLRLLDPGFQLSVKDLRSQIVRETCITIAYLAKNLESKYEFTAESLLTLLITLFQNSAKIVATSSTVAVRFIIQYTHAPRLIPVLAGHLTSKANVIRRQCFEFLDLILNTWSKALLERQVAVLKDSIKRGLSDADADARMHSRRLSDTLARIKLAFSAFSVMFREQGYSILNSFESSKQKQLLAELDDPSIFKDMPSVSSSRSKSVDRSAGNTNYNSNQRRPSESSGQSTPDLIPVMKSTRVTVARNRSFQGQSSPGRSSPASGRLTPKKISSLAKGEGSNFRLTRPKVGTSQSQPGSRSGSPNRLTFVPSLQPDVAVSSMKSSTTPVRTRKTKPLVVKSQCSSRETSPDRRAQNFRAGIQAMRRGSETPTSTTRKYSLTTQHMAEYSKNLESAVNDHWRQRATRHRSDDNSDAGSETSSVCSETSFRSYSELSEEVVDVVQSMVSGSWAERREGLIGLQRILRSEKRLTFVEVKKVVEIFTRMFHDPHPKVFSQFIETFVDFIIAHSCDLIDWFPTCLNRLLNKSGSDVLGNLQDKLVSALDALRDSFPHDHQMACAMRFIIDQQPQTLNVRVKQALLNYIQGLVSVMDPLCFTNNSDTRLAISRIITWTSEPKSPEVRKAAQLALIGFYNLNVDELTIILSALPKSFQEGAAKVLSEVKSRPPAERVQRTPQRARSTSRSAHSSPSRFGFRKNSLSIASNGCEGVDGGSLNKEDLYNGIKKASEDIQHLSLLGNQADIGQAKPKSRSPVESYPLSLQNVLVDESTVVSLLEELSNAEKSEDWLKAMGQLITVTKSCTSDEIWENHFKMILLLLLETMRDDDSKRRTLSLRALKELLENQSKRFRPYAELTIMKLLEFESDVDREVVRAAEECGTTLAKVVPFEQTISILNPISLTADFPINLAAIKLETKVIQSGTESSVRAIMPVITPGLVKSFENNESSVRKSSMLCLMAIYKFVGEDVMPLLSDLNPSKMKLLNLYISREMGQKDMPSEPTSPT